jgi:hypothetical protein
MKKETEKQIKEAIKKLSVRVTELEDYIENQRQIGKLSSPSEVTFQAIMNPDGTLTPIKRDREIIIS